MSTASSFHCTIVIHCMKKRTKKQTSNDPTTQRSLGCSGGMGTHVCQNKTMRTYVDISDIGYVTPSRYRLNTCVGLIYSGRYVFGRPGIQVVELFDPIALSGFMVSYGIILSDSMAQMESSCSIKSFQQNSALILPKISLCHMQNLCTMFTRRD